MILFKFTDTVKTCNKYIGMVDGAIEDFQISASSSRREHSPPMVRLTDTRGWCANRNDESPFIQVSF